MVDRDAAPHKSPRPRDRARVIMTVEPAAMDVDTTAATTDAPSREDVPHIVRIRARV